MPGAIADTSRGKTLRMSYHEAPAEVFEDPVCMSEWARRALAASARASAL
jgi:TfoX/Sxy family transcriptional regulator of competence genes